jgi:hypothetical protein
VGRAADSRELGDDADRARVGEEAAIRLAVDRLHAHDLFGAADQGAEPRVSVCGFLRRDHPGAVRIEILVQRKERA